MFEKGRVTGFLRTQGRIMVNGNGDEVLLRGWGMGNWNNPEGFMLGGGSDFKLSFTKELQQNGRLDRGRGFSQVITELCGATYNREFWKKWHRQYLAEADIALLAELGYNSVRLPLSARTFLEEEPGYIYNEDSFAMLDEVIGWCETYGIYAIIDLHGAVGGQSCLPCDDGVDNLPHLFLDEESAERTIVLCEELARRYKDRWIVGGYNLVNEPLSNPAWFELVPRLKAFYLELVSRIRKIDRNHMLLLEGHNFSGSVEIFDRNYDPECNNWAISIHCYERRPETTHFFHAVEKSAELNVPVWMGETGGSGKWMAAWFEMLLSHHIGYNIWCWKLARGANAANVVAFDLPEGWDEVRAYALTGGAKPGYERARGILDRYLEAIRLENCEVDRDVSNYVLRRPGCEIPAVAYDVFPGKGVSFQGAYPYGNPYHYRVGDAMRIVLAKGYTSRATIMGNPRPDTDWMNMELLLSEGEFACYTLRDLTPKARLALRMRKEGAQALLRVTAGETELFCGQVDPGEELEMQELCALPAGEAVPVKIAVEKGSLVLAGILCLS